MRDHPDGDLRGELRALLREGSRSRRALDKTLADPTAADTLVLEQARSLSQLARREQALVRKLERASGDAVPVPQARSLRERVLDLLEETSLASRAGLLAAHLELREGVPADVRRFGALRRYEAYSWQQNPGGRSAYIAPALDLSGAVYGAWMTRSDWPLDRRVIVSNEHANLLEIQQLLLLVQDAGFRERTTTSVAVMPLLAHHARRLLDVPAPHSAPDKARWREAVEEKGQLAVRLLSAQLERRIPEVASKLRSKLKKAEQLWGRQRR